MSGGIKLPSGEYWSAAGWAFRHVLDEICDALEESGATNGIYLELKDGHTPVRAYEYIEMKTWDHEKQCEFLKAVDSGIVRCKTKHASDAWGDTDSRNSFLEHFEKLSHDLHRELAR